MKKLIVCIAVLVLVFSSAISVAYSPEPTGEYTGRFKFTEVDTGTLSQMGDDFSEAQLRALFEGKFDPIVVTGAGGSYSLMIQDTVQTKVTVDGTSFDFVISLDPEVNMIYKGKYASDWMTINGTYELKTPVGVLAKGEWAMARKGEAPVTDAEVTTTDDGSATDTETETTDTGDTESEDSTETEGATDSEDTSDLEDTSDSETTGKTDTEEEATEKEDESITDTETDTTSSEEESEDPDLDKPVSEYTDEDYNRIFGLDEIEIDDEEKEVEYKFEPVKIDSEQTYRTSRQEQVAKVEGRLLEVAEKNGAEVKEDLAGRKLITTKKEESKPEKSDQLVTYKEKKSLFKKLWEYGDKAIDKIGEYVPGAKYLGSMLKDEVEDRVYTDADKVEKTSEELGVSKKEASFFNKFDMYGKIQKAFKPVKEFVINIGGKPVEYVSKALDKVGNMKKKALAYAAGKEYDVFAAEYKKARDGGKTKTEATRTAYANLKDQNYYEQGNSATFLQSLVKGDFKVAFSRLILNRESSKKKLSHRCVEYISYMKANKDY